MLFHGLAKLKINGSAECPEQEGDIQSVPEAWDLPMRCEKKKPNNFLGCTSRGIASWSANPIVFLYRLCKSQVKFL